MKNIALTYYDIGASLYVPSINKSLIEIVNKEKFPNLKSVIICFEDSILDSQVEEAEENLRDILENIQIDRTSIFIRPRNFLQFQRLLEFRKINSIDGFVIAKFDTNNIKDYLPYFSDDFYFMPVIETTDIFDFSKLVEIRDQLLPFLDSILSIRIGSEDIGKILKIKRGCEQTIYEIPIFVTAITNVISAFKPHQFNITAPIFSCYTDAYILKKEVEIDVQNGLLGKALIHPAQIDVVSEIYKITKSELEEARETLKVGCSAIVGLNGKMIEKITHKEWAEEIIMRSLTYGIK